MNSLNGTCEICEVFYSERIQRLPNICKRAEKTIKALMLKLLRLFILTNSIPTKINKGFQHSCSVLIHLNVQVAESKCYEKSVQLCSL